MCFFWWGGTAFVFLVPCRPTKKIRYSEGDRTNAEHGYLDERPKKKIVRKKIATHGQLFLVLCGFLLS